MADIVFTDAALDDLRRLGPETVPRVLQKILILATDPKAGQPLGGDLSGFRKLVVGRNTWRVVYRLIDGSTIEICEIWAVGPRADAAVYQEASARVHAAVKDRPDLMPLAKAVERLGKLAGHIVAEQAPAEPVPDWLAERLIHSAGMSRADVAAMTLEVAVDRWAEFTIQPR